MVRATDIVGIIIALPLMGGQSFFSTPPVMKLSEIVTASTATMRGHTTQTAQPAMPFAVTNFSVISTDTTAFMNGIVAPGGSFTSYWYEYGTASTSTRSTSHQMAGSGYATIHTPTYLTGLTTDTTYYFRLIAENEYGFSRGKQYTFQTTHGVSPLVGSAPRAITMAAREISQTAAQVQGTLLPHKVDTQYWFEYGKTANLGDTTAFASIGDSGSEIPVSVLVSGLDPDSTYYFRLDAQNQFGTVNGLILDFRTVDPSAHAR